MATQWASSNLPGLDSHDAFSERPFLTTHLKHNLTPHSSTFLAVGWLGFLLMAPVLILRGYWEGSSYTFPYIPLKVLPYKRKSLLIETINNTSVRKPFLHLSKLLCVLSNPILLQDKFPSNHLPASNSLWIRLLEQPRTKPL